MHASSHESSQKKKVHKPATDAKISPKNAKTKPHYCADGVDWDDNAGRFTQSEVRWLTKYVLSGRYTRDVKTGTLKLKV